MCVCVSLRRLTPRCQYHVCLIITPQSFLASLAPSVPLPSISLVPSLRVQHRTKRTVMQRECEAKRSGSNSHHDLTQLLPRCLVLSPNTPPPVKHPLVLFFYFLPHVSWFLYTSVTHNPSLCCGSQLEPCVSFFTQRHFLVSEEFHFFSPASKRKTISTSLTALCGAHCNASLSC